MCSFDDRTSTWDQCSHFILRIFRANGTRRLGGYTGVTICYPPLITFDFVQQFGLSAQNSDIEVFMVLYQSLSLIRTFERTKSILTQNTYMEHKLFHNLNRSIHSEPNRLTEFF